MDETPESAPQPDLATLQQAQTELTRQLEEAKASIAESTKTAKQKDEELQRLNQAYQRDVQTLAAYAQSLASQQHSKPAEDEDEDAFVSKKDLRKLTEEIGSAFQQQLTRTLTPLEESRLRDQRVMNKREAVRSLEHFKRYEDEIEKLLDSQPVEVSAKPGAYEAAYKLVLSQHLDEVISEKVKAATAPKPPSDDDDEQSEEPPFGERPRAEAPVAASTSVGARASVKRSRVQPLTADEKYAAEVQGVFKDTSEFRQWQNPDIEVDVFGFNGRTRV